MVHPKQNLLPRLGILGIDLEPEKAASFGNLRASRGVIVAARSVNAPSGESTALQPGDVIYELNGRSVSDLDTLRDQLEPKRSGDPLVFLVERQSILRFVSLSLP